jgi:hypothetical protein
MPKTKSKQSNTRGWIEEDDGERRKAAGDEYNCWTVSTLSVAEGGGEAKRAPTSSDTGDLILEEMQVTDTQK